MAPRKFGVVRKRSSRNWTPSSQERRSKARHEESTPRPPTAPSTSAPPPISPPKSFTCRVVTSGRKINFDFLEKEGFSIGRAIRALGWDFMCSLDLPTYPALVREFYETLAKGSGGYVSSVQGVEVRVTEHSLGRLLRLRREGPAPAVHSDREAALRLILQREDVSKLTTVSAIQLSAEMRLLHNIISRIFFPKIGRFDFISERDLIMMQCILEGIVLNLPRMMMVYIGEATQKTKASLPYGMFLTLVFRECGVQIADGETAVRLRHTDFYGRRSLERMGCEKVEGRWVRKGGEQRPVEEDEPTAIDDTVPGSPPTTSAPPAAGPAVSPAPDSVPPQAAPSTPPVVRLDDDQLRSLARMIAEETAARDQSVLVSTAERIEHSIVGSSPSWRLPPAYRERDSLRYCLACKGLSVDLISISAVHLLNQKLLPPSLMLLLMLLLYLIGRCLQLHLPYLYGPRDLLDRQFSAQIVPVEPAVIFRLGLATPLLVFIFQILGPSECILGVVVVDRLVLLTYPLIRSSLLYCPLYTLSCIVLHCFTML